MKIQIGAKIIKQTSSHSTNVGQLKQVCAKADFLWVLREKQTYADCTLCRASDQGIGKDASKFKDILPIARTLLLTVTFSYSSLRNHITRTALHIVSALHLRSSFKRDELGIIYFSCYFRMDSLVSRLTASFVLWLCGLFVLVNIVSEKIPPVPIVALSLHNRLVPFKYPIRIPFTEA